MTPQEQYLYDRMNGKLSVMRSLAFDLKYSINMMTETRKRDPRSQQAKDYITEIATLKRVIARLCRCHNIKPLDCRYL